MRLAESKSEKQGNSERVNSVARRPRNEGVAVRFEQDGKEEKGGEVDGVVEG